MTRLAGYVLLVSVLLLTGCSSSRDTLVLLDSHGCAFFVARQVSLGGAYRDPVGYWEENRQYPATIQRLPHDDQPTCNLTATPPSDAVNR